MDTAAQALTLTMAESVSSRSQTPPPGHLTDYVEEYPRLSSVRDVQCKLYEFESGKTEVWEPTPLQNPLPSEAKRREKALVARGVARGTIRIVREFKPRSLEDLISAKRQVRAIKKHQVCDATQIRLF